MSIALFSDFPQVAKAYRLAAQQKSNFRKSDHFLCFGLYRSDDKCIIQPSRGKQQLNMKGMMMTTATHKKFKVGDVVLNVFEWDRYEPELCVEEMRITTMGKVQGTAVMVADETNARRRFYADEMDRLVLKHDVEGLEQRICEEVESWLNGVRKRIVCYEMANNTGRLTADIAKCKKQLELTREDFRIRYR